MAKAKVGIIGAGPGGLACAMILAHRGFDVTVLEREKEVGGRNAPIRMNGYTFDTGPTFLMMKFVLDDIFGLAGKKSTDYLKFKRLEPMYHLTFADGTKFSPTSDKKKMAKEFERAFPGNLEGLKRFYVREKERYEKLLPCLQLDYTHFTEFFAKHFIVAIPHLLTKGSLFQNLGNYFKEDKLRLCFTFQSKYLGMSPWECPGAFTMIPFVEHEFGIYHVMGGLNALALGMAKAVKDCGGKVRTGAEVKQVIVKDGCAKGVLLKGGEKLMFDEVVINADFGYAATNLFPKGILKKYSPENVAKKRFSCSTFMLYLGVGKKYEIPHHSIYFAKDYRSNVEDIFKRTRLSKDTSFYIQNASITDSSLAPKGKSAIYILVPVANNTSKINWAKEKKRFRELVLSTVEKRTPMKDIRKHIEAEKITTPDDWEKKYKVYAGATFNLAHSLGQMLYFRPHNKFEEIGNCYLVGGGTHPGSGLPTIYESGRITANLISKAHGKG